MQPYLAKSTPKSRAILLCKAAVFRYRNRPHIEQNILDSGSLSLQKWTKYKIKYFG